MSIEVGGGLVDRLEKFKKKSKDRVKERATKKLVRKGHLNFDQKYGDHPVNAVNSEEFRTGWDRIFGAKTGDSLPDAHSPSDRGDTADDCHQNSASGNPR